MAESRLSMADLSRLRHSPEEYLSGRARPTPETGIAPGAETTLRVLFDTGGVDATGYRLYLFYPS